MSDLSNLYISQSFKGIINLADSSTDIRYQSDSNLQDGIGQNIGLAITYPDLNLHVSNSLLVQENVYITGETHISSSTYISSSLDVTGPTSINGTTDITGATTIVGNTDINGGTTIVGVTDITGDTRIEGNAVITGSLSVLGDKDIIGDIEVTGSLRVSNDISSSTLNGIGNVTEYSRSIDTRFDDIEFYTASLRTAFTASGTDVLFSNDVIIPGTLNVYKLHTTIESASVILSSGSNVLGDEPSDTQIFSGSVYVPNLHYLAGNATDTNTRIEDIRAQYLTTASYLVDSSSFDERIIRLDNFSSSINLDYATQEELTQTSSILQADIDTKLNTASYDLDSASFDSRIDTKLASSWTGSVYIPFVDNEYTPTSASLNDKTTQLINVTGSYATTGSNVFVDNQIVSASVSGEVIVIDKNVSNQFLLDCSLGNFFKLNPNDTAGVCTLVASNIQPGQTISILVPNITAGFELNYDINVIKFQSGYTYIPSPDGDDILNFISFDNQALYSVSTLLYL